MNPSPVSYRQRIPIFALLSATAISLVGSALTLVAVPWFVLQTTGSPAKTGLTGGAETLAMALAGFLGGPLVDRLGFRRASILADLLSGTAVAAIPFLYHMVGLAFWQLLSLVFLAAFFNSPGLSARLGLLPGLSRLARIPNERTNSAFEAIQNSSFLIGPPLAGVLIAAVRTRNVLWLDAASFAISAAIVAAAIPSSGQRAAGAERSPAGYLAELKEGLGFIRRDALLLSIVLTAAITNALDGPLVSVVGPVYARQNYGSAVSLGTMIAGFGGGALVGSILYGMIGHRLPRRTTFIGAFVLVGLTFWVLVASPPLPVVTGALVITGLASGPLNPLIFTIVQERTPGSMLGRVNGALISIAMAATPLGTVVMGYLLEGIGLRYTLIGIAACYLAVTLSMLLNPALQEMNKPAAIDPASQDIPERRI